MGRYDLANFESRVIEPLLPKPSDFVAKFSPFDASPLQLRPGQVRSAWANPSFKPEF